MGKDDGLDKEFEDEIRELERSTEQMPRMIMAIFLGIAVLSLTIFAVLTVGAVRTLTREVRVPGYVVEMIMRRDQQGQEYYYPVITFKLPDGTEKTVQLSDGSWPPSHQVDEQVTVAYDPEHPLRARIASDESGWLMWIGPSITGVVGLAFLGAVFFVRYFFKPETPQAQLEGPAQEPAP